MLPQKNDTFWRNLVTGKIEHEFNFMVASLLVKRLNLTTYFDPSEETISKCIDEVYDFFTKYQKFLNKDLVPLLGIPSIMQLMTVEQAKEEIKKGKNLIIAGNEKLLSALPAGNWIAGTSNSFIDKNSCITTDDLLFVNELPYYIENIKIEEFTENNIQNINRNSYDNGFTILILPFESKIHIKYAKNAAFFESIYTSPIIGWIAGDIDNSRAKIFNGKELTSSSHKGIAMYCELPKDKTAKLSIINLFKPNLNYKIEFLEDSFYINEALVNGKKVKFLEFLKSMNYDIKNPLTANLYGSFINVSFKEIINDNIYMYAPVFKGTEYHLSKPISNYVDEFNSIEQINANPVFSCHCILNYKYSELEGKKLNNFYGPSTYGEIGYILLNQTVAYLEILK